MCQRVQTTFLKRHFLRPSMMQLPVLLCTGQLVNLLCLFLCLPRRKSCFKFPAPIPMSHCLKDALTNGGIWDHLWLSVNLSLTGRRQFDPLVLRSASTGFHRTHCVLLTPACQSVYVFYEHNDKVETFLTNPTSISPALASVPQTLWAAHKYDVGLINNCQPVVITPRSDFRPHKHQYPLRQEAIDGITPVFNSLLEAGVIVSCPDSPVRTPIFPVKKIRDAGKPTEWRFVQDLKAVNAAVHARAPNVPNPYTILAQIPPEAKWFSVVDLSNAFFSVPVDKDSQFWFAFNFNGKPYTFTRLCQGYTESPTIYNDALRESLESLTLSPGSALLQYVDDCLIAAPTQTQCQTDTLKLLKHLAKEGHKASLSKLQFVSQNVRFLGHDISGEGKTLSPKRIAAIVSIPKPNTKKQMMSFLGMCSYCRSFIPNYSQMEQPLSNLIHGKNLTAHDKIIWTEEGHAAFTQMKYALQTPPTLGLPNPNKPFTQTVDERQGCMTSVLLQPHGDKLRPVAYFSAKLDPVAAGLPQCLRAVAAAERALTASRDIVGYAPLTLLVPHAVSLILLEQKSSHLSAARYLRYHTCLLDMPNVTIKRCTNLNPASLLPIPGDGEDHNCLAELQAQCTPRPDLVDTPLTNSDMVAAALPKPAEGPLHKLKPGDFVVVKDFRRKNWKARRWQGPFQILLVTQTAVKVAERATWIHASHCKKVPDPVPAVGSSDPTHTTSVNQPTPPLQ
ncbi:uncharacterized protein LOC119202433 isoform X3 [Pungitius pungitius]|uniref:uncharacterized protein LOC119202433 isoform X3 n=1 Tax=Pungitius pungitius TaxID=134920 RepID=UPI002E14AE07